MTENSEKRTDGRLPNGQKPGSLEPAPEATSVDSEFGQRLPGDPAAELGGSNRSAGAQRENDPVSGSAPPPERTAPKRVQVRVKHPQTSEMEQLPAPIDGTQSPGPADDAPTADETASEPATEVEQAGQFATSAHDEVDIPGDELGEEQTNPASEVETDDAFAQQPEVALEARPVAGLTAEDLDPITGSLRDISLRLTEMFGAIRQKDQTNRELNDELRKFRDGGTLELLRPHVNALIDLLDVFESDKSAIAPADPQNAKRVDGYIIRLQNILQDIGVYTLPPSNADGMVMFDPKKHSIVESVPNDDPALHRWVHSVVSPAYAYDDRQLRHERVKVYKVRKPGREEGSH